MHAFVIIAVFVLTYLGMAAGRLPWLQVDRTGIALLGVIALLATEAVTLDQLGATIDTSTLVLLFALMIISAQFVHSGFYDFCAEWITSRRGGPAWLLATTVGVCGGLAALLANDILVFAMAPLLVTGARSRGLDPRPFLIALASATNIGSAATLIGNPQNILIGQVGNLSFHTFLLACGVPALVGLIAVFIVTWFLWHDRIEGTVLAVTRDGPEVAMHPHDRNQTIKGAAALAALLVLFTTPLPRETGGLAIAALLLATRKFTSRSMIAAVDWPLLLLFVCLFGITGALADTGLPWTVISGLQELGLLPDNLAVLTPLTLLMSNTIGNVPSVILLLQVWPNPAQGALYGLALLSSLAGNLLLVGSLTNLIVVERAAAFGVRVTFADYARAGVPITLISMGFAVFWLAWTGWLPLWPGGTVQ
ncbi:MAG TPA: SLC13 family permease [Stellaceae bacterium]|nr:SLC13 family permease [Stellaceae bacterium]